MANQSTKLPKKEIQRVSSSLTPLHPKGMRTSVIAVTVVLVIIIGILVLNRFPAIGPGKAFHAEEVPALTGDVDAQLSAARGWAAPGDFVEIVLKVKSSTNLLTRVSFSYTADDNCFESPLPAPVAQSALNSRTNPVDTDPYWSFFTTGAGQGDEFSLASVPLRVKSDISPGTTCTASFTISDLVSSGTRLNSADLERTVSVSIAPSCTDIDGDGFGVNAGVDNDLKACGFPGVTDCDDTCVNCHPSYNQFGLSSTAPNEICDALDNNCDNVVDNSPTGTSTDGLLNAEGIPFNDLQLGVCAQTTKSCTGGNWINNYLATTYSPTESCDFLDHDCDGAANTQTGTMLSGCAIGGGAAAASPNVGTITAQTAGNVFIDYNDGNQLRFPQLLTPSDRLLYNLIHSTRTRNDCGAADQAPCTATLEPGTEVQFCKNNVYYFVERGVMTAYNPALSSPRVVLEIPNCS